MVTLQVTRSTFHPSGASSVNLFVRKKATNQQLSRLVERSVHETESSSSSEGDDKDHDVEDELFQALYETPAGMKNNSDLFKRFLGKKPSKKTFDMNTFPNKATRELFIKYITPIPLVLPWSACSPWARTS
ncbi:hypothetical protein Hamer_G008000 [Homarus americanus]|uniref:Uncharacterized protein n=1 Tax=Homarus americanus TaxID=6706 RepID=A0A8J5MT62_HOMAM|nr:hypothetical protein Hamer_G008000 [Homarus americanus]